MENSSLRILIVSNEALNPASSNGRTMMKMLSGIPADNIASFCLRGNNDSGTCSQCYIVSDRDALQAVLNPRAFSKQRHLRTKDENERSDDRPENKYLPTLGEKKIQRNCKNMVIRDLIWRTYRWWTKEFETFVRTFSPNVLLFQAGDAPFMFRISIRIAKKFKLPVVVFNTENYVLKKFMYSSVTRQTIWHWILKRRLQKAYNSMDKIANCFVYATDYLRQEYSKIYHCQSHTIYGATDMPLLEEIPHDGFVVSYIGNLGVGRHKPLMDVAHVIEEISPDAKLRIFGNFPSDSIKNEVCAIPSVEYQGIIPYDKVKQEMQKSDLLLHCESKDKLQDLIAAFSTKISDSLASGIPFLVYADRNFPFVKYLEEHGAAFVAESPSELKEILRNCMESDSFRKKNVKAARALSEANHNTLRNSEKMINILINAAEHMN